MAIYDTYPGVDEENRFPSLVRQAIAASMEVQSAIAGAIAGNPAVVAAAVAAMQDPAVQAQVAWNKPAMTSGDLDLIVTPSTRSVASLAVLHRPPVEAYGNLTVLPTSGGTITQEFVTNQGVPQAWVRNGLTDTSTWSPWVRTNMDAVLGEIYKGLIADGVNLNTVTKNGIYGSTYATHANRPPEAAGVNGVLEVRVMGIAALQKYTTVTASPEVYERRLDVDGTNVFAWVRTDAGAVNPYKGLLALNTDLNTVTQDGVYGSSGVSASFPNRPPEAASKNGVLEVREMGIGVLQKYTTVTAIPEVYERRLNVDGTNAYAWVRTDSGASSTPSTAFGSGRRDILQQQLAARKDGRIGTADLGVISLRFDDAPAEFVSKALPLLISRRIPFTRVTTSESINGVPLPAGTFPTMEAYSIQSGGEVVNHGRTHGEATGQAVLDAEIVGALDTLRTAMPRLPIDCFSPPGGSISWDGHMPSNDVSQWADTYAGQLIMSHHAMASGYFQDSYYRPLDGIIRDGQNHYSLDNYTLANAKLRINAARDWKAGVVLMWHMNNVGTAGNMSMADFTAVLDYIVTLRDAGSLLVLTMTGQSVADKTTSYRSDLLSVHSGSVLSETFSYPQFRQNIPGSTRELTATVTGSVGATVTSVIGESTLQHTIPSGGTLKLRHVATIPKDATALVVSINAVTTDAHLYAV